MPLKCATMYNSPKHHPYVFCSGSKKKGKGRPKGSPNKKGKKPPKPPGKGRGRPKGSPNKKGKK
tara:strand:- start:962 stop:1153 length:192 start_codon:yes stop_codon:yes gene_type:complete